MANEMQILGHWEVCNSRFTIYGTIDEPMFLAKEVAERIDHSDVSMMVRSVDSDEKLTQTLFVSGQGREMWLLTEYGLYEVLKQSRKPIARQFKRKVKEILRQLRRTGKYETPSAGNALPGGCALDGEPVTTVKLAAAHFGLCEKTVVTALRDKEYGLAGGTDYFPVQDAAFRRFKEQNPDTKPGGNRILLIRPSGFRKLEERFRRTIGYGRAPAPAREAPGQVSPAKKVRCLKVPPQGATVVAFPGFGNVVAFLSEGEAWFAFRDIGMAIGIDDPEDRHRTIQHIDEGMAFAGVNSAVFVTVAGIRKAIPFGRCDKGKDLMAWLTETAIPALYRKDQQPLALPPAREPKEGCRDAQTWAARARAQVTAFSTLLRTYERTSKDGTRRGTATAMEEAAEAILAAAKGMKSAAGEG